MSGNLQYGYTNLNSAKQETGNTWTGVTGSYQVEGLAMLRNTNMAYMSAPHSSLYPQYVDAAGRLQQVRYVADGAGFRVADSRLPAAPTFNPAPLVAPVDTKEVAAAKVQGIIN